MKPTTPAQRSHSYLIVRALLAFTFVCLFSLGVVNAGYIGSDLVVVTMTDGQGRSASQGIANPFANLPPQAQVPPFVQDMINERFQLSDGDTVLGWIDSLGVELIGDPVASINFNVTAASEVTVSVSSATVSFSALNNPPASAEAEVTLTDNNGNGAAMIETINGNAGLFRAIYNGSTQYAALLGDSSIGGGSVTFSEDTSGPIAGSVTSIAARFDFKLSAGDSASGSGRFVVVPEPSFAIFLLSSCATLAAARRRR